MMTVINAKHENPPHPSDTCSSVSGEVVTEGEAVVSGVLVATGAVSS